jgi:hypothetical protein
MRTKILTIAALAAFSVIIALHYVAMGWGWTPNRKEWIEWRDLAPRYDLTVTRDGTPLTIIGPDGHRYLSNDPRAGLPGAPKPPPAPNGTTVIDGRIKFPFRTSSEDGTGKSWFFAHLTFPVKQGTHWGWSKEEPLIQDIRMPLFILFVFYGGLLFILSDNKQRGSQQ